MILNTPGTFSDRAIKDAILHATETFPDESCGAVIRGEYVKFRNASETPDRSFLIKDNSFDMAYMSGDIQAVIHSHNDCGCASFEDMTQQQALDVPYGIINMRGGVELQTIFFGDSVPISPLCGRKWFFGVWDCWTLVRDYYTTEHGVTGPNPPKRDRFWERGESVFEEFIETAPFRKIRPADALAGDLLLYNMSQTSKYYDHVGVLMDRGKALHHFLGRVSAKYPISFQKKSLRAVYRLDESKGEWT